MVIPSRNQRNRDCDSIHHIHMSFHCESETRSRGKYPKCAARPGKSTVLSTALRMLHWRRVVCISKSRRPGPESGLYWDSSARTGRHQSGSTAVYQNRAWKHRAQGCDRASTPYCRKRLPIMLSSYRWQYPDLRILGGISESWQMSEEVYA